MKNKVLHSVKEEKKVLNTTKRRKVNWIRHILHRYSVLRNSLEGKVEGMIGMTGKRGKRRKQLRDGLNLKKTRGYWKLKEEALYCTLCRTGLGRDYGPVALRTVGGMAMYFV
jgi:hypothetical protein